MSNSEDVSRKAEGTYPTGPPGPCSKFIVESELLIYFVTLYVLFGAFYALCCVNLFHVWSLSLDNILLISTRILVRLITLSNL